MKHMDFGKELVSRTAASCRYHLTFLEYPDQRMLLSCGGIKIVTFLIVLVAIILFLELFLDRDPLS